MKKIILSILIVSGVAFSCDDRLEELNRPKKDATVPSGEALFANGVRGMFDMMVSTDVNDNPFRLYSQYWAQTTYPDESQYNMVSRNIPDNFWTNAYRDVLRDLDEARKVIEDTWEVSGLSEAERDNQLSMINVCKIYTFATLVDAFGAIPFSEALNDDILIPKYDDGQAVYDNLIVMLDEAINLLNENEAGFSSDQDLIYGGDVAGWIKLANSLKIKLAATIADVNPTKAATMISEAEPGAFQSNEDNATLSYLSSSPNTNPIWLDLVQSGRADYVVANTLVDKLLALSDPRLGIYADPMEDDSFKGGEYGTANTYSANSHVGALYHEPDLEGVIMDYAEVQFLLAEAAARGFATIETEETYYENGIRGSMEYWGVDDADIDAYLAQPSVAYATADGDWKQKIGTQEWIALYNRGFEGWTAWRRLDFTGFNVPDGLEESDIPRRLIFPIEEATLNPSSWRAAIDLIGGSDDVQTKIFWDVN
jgi:hypothetical protein